MTYAPKHTPMHKKSDDKRPGWGIIEQYMPDALPEEQEEAYENLKWLVKVLVEIDDRLAHERQEKELKLQPTLFDL